MNVVRACVTFTDPLQSAAERCAKATKEIFTKGILVGKEDRMFSINFLAFMAIQFQATFNVIPRLGVIGKLCSVVATTISRFAVLHSSKLGLLKSARLLSSAGYYTATLPSGMRIAVSSCVAGSLNDPFLTALVAT